MLPRIEDTMFELYANPLENDLCKCGIGRRLVQCRDCFQYQTSCHRCFVQAHHRNPFHWAQVWDEEQRIWNRTDYSAVLPKDAGIALQLGHPGDETSCSANEEPQELIVTHSNGIHSSRVRFCYCSDAGDKCTQLLRAELFPASTTHPQTVFTFAVLKGFQVHNMQSKASAFDWILGLRKLTDNVFTQKVPVSYYTHSLISILLMRPLGYL
jgi:hypothetical protein